MIDIYYTKEYAEASKVLDNGESELFIYSGEEGIIHNRYIKRKVPFILNNKQYFDITTPYGYGGPIVIDKKDESLYQAYISAFHNHCIDNDIVAEFVRFHPLLNNADEFKQYTDITYVRDVLITDLYSIDDSVLNAFSSSCRKIIRRQVRDGLTFNIFEKPKDLDVFKDIYLETMNHNKAKKFYYFDDEYFDRLINHLQNNMIMIVVEKDNVAIACSLCLFTDRFLHIHLSGTKQDYLTISPAYILRYAAIQWAKDNRQQYVHHGGGRSNDPNDSLYMFKKRFSNVSPVPFYISKIVHDKKKYDLLVKLHQKQTPNDHSGFFPEYRS